MPVLCCTHYRVAEVTDSLVASLVKVICTWALIVTPQLGHR